jgi:multidrug efflux pump subunit AcrA (membrane-fusion protein)
VRKSRKILVAVIVLVVVLAAVGRVAFKKRGGKKAETVQIAKAELGELVEFVSAPGEID